jgi:UDP-N-acetylmuramate dehydrogenase
MTIRHNVALAPYTTFFIGGPADYFIEVTSFDELKAAVGFTVENGLPRLILGQGSNVLIADTGFRGVVIRPLLKGISIVSETETDITVAVAAGEVWDEVVAWAVKRDLWGIENLSHIPGLAGAFPVQNVGAYGQDASQVIASVTALNTTTFESEEFTNAQCNFSYRTSRFNTTDSGQYIITSISLTLHKQAQPKLSYPDLQKYFASNPAPSLNEIREAIITIRNQKYPYPSSPEQGSAGSFFQHPKLTNEQFAMVEQVIHTTWPKEVQLQFQAIKEKFGSETQNKLAGFLIDICGLKGYLNGGAAISSTQPLVVRNLGHATSSDVMAIANTVQTTISQHFPGVTIPIEPQLIGF